MQYVWKSDMYVLKDVDMSIIMCWVYWSLNLDLPSPEREHDEIRQPSSPKDAPDRVVHGHRCLLRLDHRVVRNGSEYETVVFGATVDDRGDCVVFCRRSCRQPHLVDPEVLLFLEVAPAADRPPAG